MKFFFFTYDTHSAACDGDILSEFIEGYFMFGDGNVHGWDEF